MSLEKALSRLFPALLILGASGLGAQEASPQEREPDAFGISSSSVLIVGSYAFQSRVPTIEILSATGLDRYSAGNMIATAEMPAGSELVRVELGACDTSNTGSVALGVGLCGAPGTGCSAVSGASVDTGAAATPGCGFFPKVLPSPATFDHSSLISLLVSTGSDTSTTFSAVKLFYRLRVSPGPASATFADVPTSHLYFRAVEALAAAGITGGCGKGNFCPDQPVTRGELAKFLATALGLHWPG